jgi:hypothetical protein
VVVVVLVRILLVRMEPYLMGIIYLKTPNLDILIEIRLEFWKTIEFN